MSLFPMRRNQRRGSALLICTLAATVLSMAAIAILRSTQRNIARVDALAASASGRCVSEGLLQRSIALLRQNPNTQGVITDATLEVLLVLGPAGVHSTVQFG